MKIFIKQFLLITCLSLITNALSAQLTVTGTVTADNLSTTGTIVGGTFSGTLGAGTLNNITTLGALTGLTVTGTATATTLSGTLTAMPQPNITAMGGLTNITITGTLTQSAGVTSLNNNSNFTSSLNTGTSTGTVDIGGTAAQTINIGAGATGVKTINIGTGAVANQILLGNAATAGNLVGIHVAVPTARLHLGPGTTSVAPFKLSSGTIITASEAGAIEYDGDALYATHTSGRGILPTTQYTAIQTDFGLSNVNTAQTAFHAVGDVLTVAGSTTYFFEGQYIMTTGTTSHTTAISWALGTASVTSFEYTAILWSAALNALTTTLSATHVSGVASRVLNAASILAWTIIKFEGVARINAAGTITPQITFSAAPGGTNTMKVGSYIKFTPIGTGIADRIGPWN